MNGLFTGVEWQLYGAVLLGLFFFGLFFNDQVGKMGDAKDGYTALLVALGVAVTLIGVALVSWKAALLVLGAFVASGIPMIYGDISRAVRARQDAVTRAREDAKETAGKVSDE